MNAVKVCHVTVGKTHPLTLISGPCVIESRDHTLLCAEKLVEITRSLPIQLIFKASYDKANRTSYQSFRGPGMKRGALHSPRGQRPLSYTRLFGCSLA